MTSTLTSDLVIAGAGIAGIATAYHAVVSQGLERVVLADPRPPLTLTSDKSTECYRNWWPGPDDTMVSFMNRSIDLLEQWSNDSGDAFKLNRRGYLYVTGRRDELDRMAGSAREISQLGAGDLREHGGSTNEWRDFGDGADLFTTGDALRQRFPALSGDVVGGLHVRRAGWLSAQQLGMWLLDQAREHGTELVKAEVVDVEIENGAVAAVRFSTGSRLVTTSFVNAAGPMLAEVARLVGVDLPVHSEVHRKVSFADRMGVVPRDAPLMIWNDPQRIEWSEEEREALQSDSATADLVDVLPAGAHCRPDGPDGSTTVLGLWEYRTDVRAPVFPIPVDDMCPEMVIRGLAPMLPRMEHYLERMPKPYVDGGYYTKTSENRPLIGPVGPRGSFVVGALSGYGVMAAPAAGELVVRHMVGASLPDHAQFLAPNRYSLPAYRSVLAAMTDLGQL